MINRSMAPSAELGHPTHGRAPVSQARSPRLYDAQHHQLRLPLVMFSKGKPKGLGAHDSSHSIRSVFVLPTGSSAGNRAVPSSNFPHPYSQRLSARQAFLQYWAANQGGQLLDRPIVPRTARGLDELNSTSYPHNAIHMT